MRKTGWLFLLLMVLLLTTGTLKALAHCDTMDGPVIKDALRALETGQSLAVLKWVKKDREAEVLQAFEKAVAEREAYPDIKDKTDREFFETLVRIHREGEGESFEGIKPSGTLLEPGIRAADEAIETGAVDLLVGEITAHISQETHERFQRVAETRKHKEESVEAGREYVEAYVQFVHYVEALHKAGAGAGGHHHE